MTETEKERDERLKELASRIGKVMDGEKLLDVASVCALVSVYSIKREEFVDAEARQKAFDDVIGFMRRLYDMIPARDYSQENGDNG